MTKRILIILALFCSLLTLNIYRAEAQTARQTLYQSKDPNAKYSVDGRGAKKGYRGFFELGNTIGTGSNGDTRVEIYTSHGYQFNPYFFIGAGIGITYYNQADVVMAPIYGYLRCDFLNNSITPFVDFKVGYTIGQYDGVFTEPSLGCRIAVSNKSALSLSLGYASQMVHINYLVISPFPTVYQTTCNDGGFLIKLSFDF